MPGFVYTNTAPTLNLPVWSYPLALTTTVSPSPLTATDHPNRSTEPSSGDRSFTGVDVSDHPPAGRGNTYAAPALLFFSCAPATMVSPFALTATEKPNWSPAAVSVPKSLLPVGVDAGSHPPDGLVYTYAAPAPAPSCVSPRAPTTTVLPSALAATSSPNLSL